MKHLGLIAKTRIIKVIESNLYFTLVFSFRLFALYQLYYSSLILKYSQTIYTTNGFLVNPITYFGISAGSGSVYTFHAIRVLIAMFLIVFPLRSMLWLVFGTTEALVLMYSPMPPSIAFPPSLHMCIVISFLIWTIRLRDIGLLTSVSHFAYFGFSMFHCTSALAKLFSNGTLWPSGEAFREILFTSVWCRTWYAPYLFIVPTFLLKSINYMVLVLELFCGFMFTRKTRIIFCIGLISMHLGALIIFALEEISFCFISCGLITLILLIASGDRESELLFKDTVKI